MLTEFDTPISFHIFNRPELTEKSFLQIKKIKPKQLFITADGPREDNQFDKIKCQEAREIVEDIDWECEIYKNYSKDNKGSYKSTSGGISWVFEHVDRAIILEDDCIPLQSFFLYCQELLEHYKYDERVAVISGNTFVPNKYINDHSYYFSRYSHIWGWATWKRTWNKVDLSMEQWPIFNSYNGLNSIFHYRNEVKHWQDLYQNMYDNAGARHWDYLLSLSLYMNNSLSIIPSTNLVSNVGYGANSTNTKIKTKLHELKKTDILFPLKHPEFISRNYLADQYVEKSMFSRGLTGLLKKKIEQKLPSILVELIKKIWRNISSNYS